MDPRQLGGLDPEGAELPEQGQEDRSRPDSPADEDESCRPPSSSSAAPLKATRSLLPPEWSSSASDAPAEGEEFRRNPLYLTCGGAEDGSVQRGGPTYAEVLQRPTSTRRTLQEPDPGNTNESVEEVKEKNSTWGRSQAAAPSPLHQLSSLCRTLNGEISFLIPRRNEPQTSCRLFSIKTESFFLLVEKICSILSVFHPCGLFCILILVKKINIFSFFLSSSDCCVCSFNGTEPF